MEPLIAKVACRCGDMHFQVRVDKNEQVGLATCTAGHDSLLLDSRDYWAEVIQDGRPPIARCRCKSNRFLLSLHYQFRADGDVASVEVVLHCSACAKEKRAATFEIDYSPTESLVSAPLEPCSNPWLVARRRTYTGLWSPADTERALRLIADGTTRIWFAGWKAPIVPVEIGRACELVLEALSAQRPYDVLLSNSEVDLRDAKPRACWKSLPILQLKSPMSINYPTKDGGWVNALLHDLEFAEEVVVHGAIVSQPAEFREFAAQAIDRLSKVFISTRGPRSLDAPDEYARVAPAL